MSGSDASAALGSWDDVFGQASTEVQRIAETAAGVIRAADPDTVETARPGDRAVTYGIGPAKMKDGYAYLMPQKDRVNLGFYEGAGLPDPDGLLEGTGKALRHVKLRSAVEATSPAVRALVAAAVERRRAQ